MFTPQHIVIGISAPSGGGKTTVADRLVTLLSASLISFDDYDHLTIHPASYRQWLDDGADYNAWQTPHLTADLQRLKAGQAISSPRTGAEILPATYLVFDAPLGRAHHATGALIDFMVYLNTPLDVAMARRLLRDLAQAAPSHPAQHLAQIRIELATYLDFGRVAYLEMEQQIRPKCDLILDGLSPPDMLARQIVDQVKSQYEQLPTTDN